jgi:N-acetylmuramoyl-L-alanine amidase
MNKKQIYLLIFLPALWMVSDPVRSEPSLRIVQPYENASLPAIDSSFVFGSVSPATCTLTINGVPVQPYSNGGFLVMIPFQEGKFRIDAIAFDGISTATVTRQLTVASPARSFPENYEQIEPLSPRTRMILRVGDTFNVSFQSAPGGEASFKVEGQDESFPMNEHAGSIKGIYKGVYRVQAGDRFNGEDIVFYLKPPHGKRLSKKAGASITVQKKHVPRYVELNEDATVLTAPDTNSGYQLFFLKGVRLEVIGETGDFYRVAVGPLNEGWIKKSVANELPVGTVQPRSTAYNIRISTTASSTLIEIPLQYRHPHRIEQYTDPHRLVLSLYGVTADADRIRYKASSPVVKDVSWQQMDTETFVLDVMTKQKYPWGYDVRYEGTNLVLEIRHHPLVNPSKGTPLKGLRIAIDAGHSKQSFGTIGPWGNTEASVNLAVATTVKQELEKKGGEVIMIQDGTRDPSLRERSEMAWKEKAHVYISIHCDASPEGQNPRDVEGYSVHYFTPQSRVFGEDLHALYGQRTKIRDQGLWRSNRCCWNWDFSFFLNMKKCS